MLDGVAMRHTLSPLLMLKTCLVRPECGQNQTQHLMGARGAALHSVIDCVGLPERVDHMALKRARLDCPNQGRHLPLSLG